ncbi:hypothetical protein StrepF001_07825 [Streptomyces sp. F001]|nr:hypothetical protein StrepF001_07825 [Streptomyces sp. F001]
MIPMFGLRELAIILIGVILLLGAKRLPNLVRSVTRPIGKPVRPRCAAPPPGRSNAECPALPLRYAAAHGRILGEDLLPEPSKPIPHQRRPLP